MAMLVLGFAEAFELVFSVELMFELVELELTLVMSFVLAGADAF